MSDVDFDAWLREHMPDVAADASDASDAAQWQAENKDALDSSNAFVEEHGLPLRKFQR